jgi:DNA-binding Lrp family transcriptional regulator
MELAKLYYMQNESQRTIAEKVGVSETTLSKWVKAEKWEMKRAGTQITRQELINKLLLSINHIIELTNNAENAEAFAGMGDKLSKIASVIERLDKKANIVTAIDVFIAFGKWLEARIGTDKEFTTEFLKKVTRHQDAWINEQFNILK